MCLAWEEARKNSKHDAVLWLNDDTLLFPTALKTMMDMATEHPTTVKKTAIFQMKEVIPWQIILMRFLLKMVLLAL